MVPASTELGPVIRIEQGNSRVQSSNWSEILSRLLSMLRRSVSQSKTLTKSPAAALSGQATSAGPSRAQTSFSIPEIVPPVPPKTCSLWPATAVAIPVLGVGKVPLTLSAVHSRLNVLNSNRSFIAPEVFAPPKTSTRCEPNVAIPMPYRASGKLPPMQTEPAAEQMLPWASWIQACVSQWNEYKSFKGPFSSSPPKMYRTAPKATIP
mmetsp:Transcript_75723/g.202672  ORF Transcript_75723/g.202672 Transcript_75723/m.202672 type:complete len:208 (+) Transcript_75723:1358-1981(+)